MIEGMTPGSRSNPAQVVHVHVPLSPSSIIWYPPMRSHASQTIAVYLPYGLVASDWEKSTLDVP